MGRVATVETISATFSVVANACSFSPFEAPDLAPPTEDPFAAVT
jgi:hypothetical protein